MPKHNVCHIEFYVSDLPRAQAFYEGLFGWDFRAFTDDMVVFGQGDQHIGGLMKSDDIRTGNSPSVWFEVEDVDAMAAKVGSIGGSVVAEKHPVPHVGWALVVADPDGNPVGMVQFSA